MYDGAIAVTETVLSYQKPSTSYDMTRNSQYLHVLLRHLHSLVISPPRSWHGRTNQIIFYFIPFTNETQSRMEYAHTWLGL